MKPVWLAVEVEEYRSDACSQQYQQGRRHGLKFRKQHLQVEFVQPPEGAAVGDRVTAEGFPGEPDEVLNPKKKVRTSHWQCLPKMVFACVIWRPVAWS